MSISFKSLDFIYDAVIINENKVPNWLQEREPGRKCLYIETGSHKGYYPLVEREGYYFIRDWWIPGGKFKLGGKELLSCYKEKIKAIEVYFEEDKIVHVERSKY